MGIEQAYEKAKAKTVALDEQEQAAYIALRFEPKTDVLIAAARVIVAAQEYLQDNGNGVISLHAARLGALRFAVLQYEQAVG